MYELAAPLLSSEQSQSEKFGSQAMFETLMGALRRQVIVVWLGVRIVTVAARHRQSVTSAEQRCQSPTVTDGR